MTKILAFYAGLLVLVTLAVVGAAQSQKGPTSVPLSILADPEK